MAGTRGVAEESEGDGEDEGSDVDGPGERDEHETWTRRKRGEIKRRSGGD